MVNIARQIGLTRDPDETSGTPSPLDSTSSQGGRKSKNKANDSPVTSGRLGAEFGLFESEMRRRMWWDVFYYDLYRYSPLIPDSKLSPVADSCRMRWDIPR